MRRAGYAFLADLPGVTAIGPARPALVAPVTRVTPTARAHLVPTHVGPSTDALLDQVLFALKHEGVDLQILAQVLPLIPADELRQAITAKPGGTYVRKVCYLWEIFTGQQLVERPRVSGAAAPLFDPERYLTGPSRYDTRWRVDFNGLGTPYYCATVERTEAVAAGLASRVVDQAKAFLQQVQPDVLERAMSWAYLEETRQSFAIEDETPTPQKATAFAQLLRKAHDRRDLSEDYLVDLHAATITNPLAAEFSFRTMQNWLAGGGSSSSALNVTYVPPPPDLARELMGELMDFANSDLGDIDPIVLASVISFGFVYLHPFMDGNGRLSRFLFHHTLCRSGQLPEGMVLPVSGAIAKNLPAYAAALQRYSAPMRAFWAVTTFDLEHPGLEFNGHPSLYRYWNATAAVEFGFRMTRSALDVQLIGELQWLKRYDRVIAAVNARFDIRGPALATLVTVCLNNGNRLSKRKRERYASIVEAEAFDYIEECAQRSDEDHDMDREAPT